MERPGIGHSRLIGTTPAAPDDQGDADPVLAAALAADDTQAALERLLLARLIVPVVAVAAATADADMAVPALVDAFGAKALPAFSCIDAMKAWQPDARPVPMVGARVVAGAAGEGYSGVVLDVAGPHPLQLRGSLLDKLAAAARLLLDS